jgi:hypothetical protein
MSGGRLGSYGSRGYPVLRALKTVINVAEAVYRAARSPEESQSKV